ncbi:DoxX family protein [Aeromicrobium sp.]|uniref:DoxX family protein n=1 Tax=Aeromicrobium sp. TaxID=1871063 RepID=UPI003C636C62
MLTVLAIVVAITFVITGGVKLFNVPASLAIRDSLDVPPGQWRLIGVLEWLGAAGVAIGLAYRPLGLVASIALAALLVGAMFTRVRAAGRHDRSEATGLALDTATLVLAAAAAVAFAASL